MDLFDKRCEYNEEMLEISDLLQDPAKQFEDWYKVAEIKIKKDPNAFVLSTVDQNACPSSRVVLMKQFSQEGLVFFSNYKSQKAKEIASSNKVTALFYWPILNRQIRLTGKAFKLDRSASEAYFLSRPKDSQISALVSPQSEVIENKQYLIDKIEAIKTSSSETLKCPDYWGGYIIKPETYEFWQGSPNRLHDRFRYQMNGTLWDVDRLAP